MIVFKRKQTTNEYLCCQTDTKDDHLEHKTSGRSIRPPGWPMQRETLSTTGRSSRRILGPLLCCQNTLFFVFLSPNLCARWQPVTWFPCWKGPESWTHWRLIMYQRDWSVCSTAESQTPLQSAINKTLVLVLVGGGQRLVNRDHGGCSSCQNYGDHGDDEGSLQMGPFVFQASVDFDTQKIDILYTRVHKE